MKLNALLMVILPFISIPVVAATWLANVNIIDGAGSPLLRNQHIQIVEGRISKIVDADNHSESLDGVVIDLSGKYVLPGLFDSHVHLATDPSGEDNILSAQQKLKLMLQSGITGVRDMAGDNRVLGYLSRQAELDEILAPNIYYSALMAGPSFFDDPRTQAAAKGKTAGQAWWMKAISSSSNFPLEVAAAKGTGATGIKLYADLPSTDAVSVIKQAKAQNFLIWSHAAVIPSMPSDVVNAGITSVSHATQLAWEADSNKPTSGKQRYGAKKLDIENPKFKALIDSMVKQNVFLDATVHIFKNRKDPQIYLNGVLATQAAYAAGVKIVAGTDMAVDPNNFQHLPLLDEMMALQDDVGMSAADVIMAATLHPAQMLKVQQQQGSINVGKRANLLIVERNPIKDLTAINDVYAVFKNGKQVQQ